MVGLNTQYRTVLKKPVSDSLHHLAESGIILKTMWRETKNGKRFRIRQLVPGDEAALLAYLDALSLATRQRFAPHPFDADTIQTVCTRPDQPFRCFVAEDAGGQLAAYMLARLDVPGHEFQRLAGYGVFPEPGYTASFAPSVADHWQHSGIGSAMYGFIEQDLRQSGIRQIMLMGGVQSDNLSAIRYYEKLGFQKLGGFWHESVFNEDMVRWLI